MPYSSIRRMPVYRYNEMQVGEASERKKSEQERNGENGPFGISLKLTPSPCVSPGYPSDESVLVAATPIWDETTSAFWLTLS